ncbi:MAG TPA: sodium/solute symporter [Thermoanaerobaculia bacterium]|nr:sodium/solute symporter [Thermoanaerobaculia bacterium]
MTVSLAAWDYIIVAVYLAAIVGISAWLALGQSTGREYFLAGRNMGGSTLALSIMANQASAVSLVGAPAFVALREGGGLRWLQYELALPLAMLVLIWLLLPAIRSAPGASIYGYAEARFGAGVRRALAASFLLSRGLALGVILYASALVVGPAFGMRTSTALVVVGIFCVAYTSLGGILADIWSDVMQLAILWVGTIIGGAFILWKNGAAVLHAIPVERTRTLVVDSLGIGDGNSFALAPMLVGGLFLYLSYYGCDQTQAQRLLTARDDASAQRALLLNGLLRFPLVLTYCAFGLLLAGLLQIDPAFAALMNGRAADDLVPTFLMAYLPSGFRGIMLAGIFAAAMSSIDSALNSLAAVTLDDVFGMDAARQSVWTGRWTSLFWGVFAIVSGLVFASNSRGVLELIGQVGSIFYGPVLGVFLLGAMTRHVRGRHALIALAIGLTANVLVAAFAKDVSWLWWNAIGCVATVMTALLAAGRPVQMHVARIPVRAGIILASAFVLMVTLLLIVGIVTSA